MTFMIMMAFFLGAFSIENIGAVVFILMFSLVVELTNMSWFSYNLLSEWVGLDSMGSLMMVLVVLVTMISVVSSCKDMKVGKMSKMGGFTMLEMVGLICLSSLLFFQSCSWMDFYFFFEFSLVPTFYLILKWGYRPERLNAATYLIMYTVSCSSPLLMGLMWCWDYAGSDNMLLAHLLKSLYSKKLDWAWFLMSLGFMVKLPMYGLHGWLPKVHVEAPLSGSMLLSGILLKFGGYGLIRLFWFGHVFYSEYMQFLLAVSLWGGIMSSMMCLCQSDLKSLIAYSSIGHMALGVSSFLTFCSLGKLSFVCIMFGHGLCSPILFSLAASSYDISKSRNILLTKGVSRMFPMFSFMWFVFCAINMGCPPSINFFGEVFAVSCLVWKNLTTGILGAVICFFTGSYCVVLYGLVGHGGPSVLVDSYVNLSMRYLVSATFVMCILVGGGFCIDLFFV